MDERGRQLQAQLQFMERNGRALEELVAKMLRAREEQEAFHAVFAKSLQDISAQEDNRAISQTLASLGASGGKMAGGTHEVMLLRPETEILQVLAHVQDWGVMPMKQLTEDRDKAIKILHKLQKESDEKSRAGSAKEKEKRLRMLSDQRRRVENVNTLIDLHMAKFEQFRTGKMKKVLTEIARSNVFYHAKGLEAFAVPCTVAAKIAGQGDSLEETP